MLTRVVITLSEQERAALVAFARDELRHPREQASIMIRTCLEQRGYLNPKSPTPVPFPDDSMPPNNEKRSAEPSCAPL